MAKLMEQPADTQEGRTGNVVWDNDREQQNIASRACVQRNTPRCKIQKKHPPKKTHTKHTRKLNKMRVAPCRLWCIVNKAKDANESWLPASCIVKPTKLEARWCLPPSQMHVFVLLRPPEVSCCSWHLDGAWALLNVCRHIQTFCPPEPHGQHSASARFVATSVTQTSHSWSIITCMSQCIWGKNMSVIHYDLWRTNGIYSTVGFIWYCTWIHTVNPPYNDMFGTKFRSCTCRLSWILKLLVLMCLWCKHSCNKL